VTNIKAAVVDVDLLFKFFITLSERGNIHGGSRLKVPKRNLKI
jgi:hypothetical protein